MNSSVSGISGDLLADAATPKATKRRQSGKASTDVILSSFAAANNEVFPRILELHVKPGSRIADITFGKGVFWRDVDTNRYEFFPSDLKTGTDARDLPYESATLDAIVFDPPYMEGLYRRSTDHLAGGGSHSAFRDFYSNGTSTPLGSLKYHDAVLDMYMSVACEVHRVLRDRGVFIVKCQDEVSANRQKLTHVELIYGYASLGYYCKDLFVVTRVNRPVISRLVKQEHARKSHSYFLVFIKHENAKLPYENFRDLLRSYQVKTSKIIGSEPRVGRRRSPKSRVQSAVKG